MSTLFLVFFGFLIKNTTANLHQQISENHTRMYQNSFNESVLQTKISPKLICFYLFTHDFKADIMDDLCTHIIVGFFSINPQTYFPYTSNDNLKLLTEVTMLKKTNKNLKIILSVGGSTEGTFSHMIKNHTTRKMFIRNTVKLIKQYKVDGIDLDWEWPVLGNGDVSEKVKFTQLLYEFRKVFDKYKKKYFLSVDVASLKQIIDLSYYVRYMAEYVDLVNVMCYDYHFYSTLLPLTGHNAPLYSSKSDLFNTYNTNYSIQYWILNSMPREKIFLGLPTYGHTFRLSFPENHTLGAPASGYGSLGSEGFVYYSEICRFIASENATVVYDNYSKVPYVYNVTEWVSFDNEMSLAIKASYVLEEKLGGVMVFAVNTDDFKGECNGRKLPLIRKIRSILYNEV